MRQLTEKAIENFLNDTPFKKSNTEVIITKSKTILSLFKNRIAFKVNDKIAITNAGYKNTTTKERLNGLPGVNIQQKDGKWYLNGQQWNGEFTVIN